MFYLGLCLWTTVFFCSTLSFSSSSLKKCYHSILCSQWNNTACVFKLLGEIIHCFFRRICFPKLNFQNSEHLITLSQAFSLKMEKERGRGSLLGLVPVKSDLSGDLFFFWRQIRCSNQAVFEDWDGMFMGFLVRLILKQQHIPRG